MYKQREKNTHMHLDMYTMNFPPQLFILRCAIRDDTACQRPYLTWTACVRALSVTSLRMSSTGSERHDVCVCVCVYGHSQ